ncbi:MBL fold metallo-hydrolase [Demequina sp.]|uniref:MBL fold metallo-hydrolase RNA specificity domain-containing protein n=1 Tax=Demequina sp. TaxID=2050685 RepID=UPI0025BF4990|nr:MBL fold metallo-hydrolase [Demequina sp.]
MRDATLTFLGATGTVTGSKFLLQTDGHRVLVDAGLFQGVRELRRRNWAPFPVDPSEIDGAVLTHAHLDHCGYLPALVRQGFEGPVVCTEGTAELAAIVLKDSAHLQEEDARYAADKGFSKHAQPRPLYNTADVARALPMLQPVDFGRTVEVCPGVEVTLQPAGHILGSASAVLDVVGHRITFSGDLGRPGHPLLRPPPRPPESETIVVESTYGNRDHVEGEIDQFAEVVNRTIERGGTVLIPAFAVDRTEIVLVALDRLMNTGRIPQVPVYVDSPMALRALGVYRQALAVGNPELRTDLEPGVLDPRDVQEAHTPQQSMALNRPGKPCIIVSASGMATGGRVVHHLRHLLPDRENSVVLVGFQAAGTRGRDLVEGATEVKMHGRYVPVHAEIVQIDGFSVHADADEILGWLASTPSPPKVLYVVHGEPESSAALAARVRSELGWLAVVPRHGERVRLG